MELVAGDAREILLVVVGSDESRDAFEDRGRFEAHLALGGGLDPTWLDLFAEAARTVTDQDGPPDFLDARIELGATEPVAEIDGRARRPGLDRHGRPAPRFVAGRASPGAGSTSSRRSSGRSAARGEAVDPRARGPGRGVLPRRRPGAGRPLRSGRCGDRRGPRRVIRGQPGLWDAWTAIHAAGEFYDLAAFRAGGDPRSVTYEIAALGDVAGRSLLHLQCHFGIDTLSWARLGARVTGADFSPAAIALARELADDLGFPEARFVESNLYDLPRALDGDFDIVYTSRGVLGWLPDIRAWAEVVAHFLAPGGTFFISEIHPVAQVFENEGRRAGRAPPRLSRTGSIASRSSSTVTGSYADPTADVGEQRRARLGPRPGRDRDRADRGRAAHRVPRRASLPRVGGGLPRRKRARQRPVHPAAGHGRRAAAHVHVARHETGRR